MIMNKYFVLLKLAYAEILRPLVAEKVASTDAKWDDIVLKALDKLFDYNG